MSDLRGKLRMDMAALGGFIAGIWFAKTAVFAALT